MSKFHFGITHTLLVANVHSENLAASTNPGGRDIILRTIYKNSCEENIELHAC